MKRSAFFSLLALIAAPAAPAALHAQAAQTAQAAAPRGARADLLAQFDDAATKISQLAEAIGQDKYGWRPGEGVRSVSEALVHVAGGNYYLLTFAGVQHQSHMPQNAEKTVTDKGQVAALLKESFDHARNAIRNANEAEFDKPVTMFGRATTVRNVYLTTVTHMHEHLGQLIAYARANGVVPPWSRGGM